MFVQIDQERRCVTAGPANISPTPVDQARASTWVPRDICLARIVVAEYEFTR